MKPTSSYKMRKSTKFILSNIHDKHKRGEIKRDYIRADLLAAIKPKEGKKNKSDTDEE